MKKTFYLLSVIILFSFLLISCSGLFNKAPILKHIGNKSIQKNTRLEFSVYAEDAENDVLNYYADNLPSGAYFSDKTFSWTPNSTGVYYVTFRVSDDKSETSETISITVDSAPLFIYYENEKNIAVNKTLNFTLTATDNDNDNLTYSAENLPDGAVFKDGTFTWTPSSAGEFVVTFKVSDGTFEAKKNIKIIVHDTVIIFNDAILENYIRGILQKPIEDIYPSDVSNITGLSFTGTSSKISDITGLSYFKKLISLNFRNNRITDVSSLSTLTGLTFLDLSGNTLSDISPLKSLTNLNTLNLQQNAITDISSLNGLTNLNTLNLSQNSISDISALQNLKNIKNLNLSYNKTIENISYLKDLTEITTLNLTDNKISDISYLKNLINLTTLDISRNNIIDISYLKPLIKMEKLFAYSNNISDISSLEYLQNLKNISINDNKISDISALVKNTGLGSSTTLLLGRNINLGMDSPDVQTLLKRGVHIYF